MMRGRCGVLMKNGAWELLSCEISKNGWISDGDWISCGIGKRGWISKGEWVNSLLHSFIAHDCLPDPTDVTDPIYYKYKRPCWSWIGFIDRACMRCGEYPPEDIMGLWMLHNWDYIQDGE